MVHTCVVSYFITTQYEHVLLRILDRTLMEDIHFTDHESKNKRSGVIVKPASGDGGRRE